MPKRTGLGRGIGALIPTIEATEDRPSDVFFPKSATEDDAPASSAADVVDTADESHDLVAVPGAPQGGGRFMPAPLGICCFQVLLEIWHDFR